MIAFSKDVLITLLRDKTSTEKPQAVVGSKRVQAHMQRAQAPPAAQSSSDPWMQPGHDPQANGASQPSTGSVPSKRMDPLRDQLSSELRQHLTDQITGDTCSTENERFAKLETGMAELQAQGHQFRQWLQFRQRDGST